MAQPWDVILGGFFHDLIFILFCDGRFGSAFSTCLDSKVKDSRGLKRVFKMVCPLFDRGLDIEVKTRFQVAKRMK